MKLGNLVFALSLMICRHAAAIEPGRYLISGFTKNHDNSASAIPGYFLTIGKDGEKKLESQVHGSPIIVDSLDIEDSEKQGFVIRAKFHSKDPETSPVTSATSYHFLLLQCDHQGVEGCEIRKGIGWSSNHIEARISMLPESP